MYVNPTNSDKILDSQGGKQFPEGVYKIMVTRYIIACEASFLVCSMARMFAIYIYNYFFRSTIVL